MDKPDRLTIKILPSYYDALRRLAEDEQEPVSVVVRRLIKQAAKERGVWPGEREAATCRN